MNENKLESITLKDLERVEAFVTKSKEMDKRKYERMFEILESFVGSLGDRENISLVITTDSYDTQYRVHVEFIFKNEFGSKFRIRYDGEQVYIELGSMSNLNLKKTPKAIEILRIVAEIITNSDELSLLLESFANEFISLKSEIDMESYKIDEYNPILKKAYFESDSYKEKNLNKLK